MQVQDIMSTNVKTVTSDQLVKDIAIMMIMDHISGAPVVDDDNNLVGIISEKDILQHMFPKLDEVMSDTHSWSLSIVYFSVTVIVARISPDFPLIIAISSPALTSSSSVDNVTGIGQNKPLAIVMLSQTPFQSASPIKPSKGLKPPMPSITTSPSSLEEQVIFAKDSALDNSADNASPDNANALIVSLPCGGTNFDMSNPILI